MVNDGDESILGGKVRTVRRKRGINHPYNYLDERLKLARMLNRPVWVEYPQGTEPGSIADFPLIHASLGGASLWIADDDEGSGLLGMDELERKRLCPQTQWIVIIELEGRLLARERSAAPTMEGLTAALRTALENATLQPEGDS